MPDIVIIKQNSLGYIIGDSERGKKYIIDSWGVREPTVCPVDVVDELAKDLKRAYDLEVEVR